MQPAHPLPNEARRLDDLKRTGLLDSPADERFDRITRLARELFDVPIAAISLVDDERQWFLSRLGLDTCQTSRDVAFCAHTIHDDMLVVEDAQQDPRFADNPLVTGSPHIRFYAGVTLNGPAGQPIGTLCLIDTRPRTFDGQQRLALTDLGSVAQAEVLREERLAPPTRRAAGSVERRLASHWAGALHTRAGAIATALLVGCILVFAAVAWDESRLQTHLGELRSEVLQESALIRGRLESLVNQKLHLTDALHGYVRAGGSTDEQRFTEFASALAEGVPGIRSLQLAPGGVVTHVWPLEGNRKAIGHDLLADPARRAAAERAISARKPWIAGPFELLQGGVALIAREPIFVSTRDGEEQFWGFATILIDTAVLYQEAGLAASTGGMDLALRGKDGLGANGAVFFGDETVFERDPKPQEITLPAGSWQLGVALRDGATSSYPDQPLFLALAVLVVLVAMGLVYVLLRLPARWRDAVHRATARIEHNWALFQDAIESLPSGFVIYDTDGGLVSSNEMFRAMHPASRARLTRGLRLEELTREAVVAGDYLVDTHTASLDERVAEMTQAMRSGAAVEIELSDGRWIRAMERPMRDGGTVGFRVDITELKRGEADLARAKAHAEQANQAKSEFLASVSHEVRTPMNGVLGLLGVLKDDADLGEKQREYAQTAHKSANHLLTILNEILDITKIEAGKLELEQLRFDLVDICHESLDLVATDAEAKGLTLEFDVMAAPRGPVLGDPGRLRQVLLNLVSNAVKFTENGQVAMRVECADQDDDSLRTRIVVSDTGPGFAPELAESLFERFRQADASTVRKHGGTGLGLTISRQLVRMMGGTIRAESEPGHGATFTVEIPFKRAVQAESTEQAVDLESIPTPAGKGLQPVRVLVAEDSPTNQLVLGAMLQGTGYQLDFVADGEEAVEAVARMHYDLVLMDVQMPGLDGVEATRLIRNDHPDKARLPILALTANAMKGDRERYLAAGMCDYLPKPVNKAQLLERLWHWSQVAAQALPDEVPASSYARP